MSKVAMTKYQHLLGIPERPLSDFEQKPREGFEYLKVPSPEEADEKPAQVSRDVPETYVARGAAAGDLQANRNRQFDGRQHIWRWPLQRILQEDWSCVVRMVCQFSCGAASAVATKLTLAKYPANQVLIVNAFIVQEDSDNRRFLADCEKWFERSIVILRDEKYGASTHEVWRRKRFIKGLRGAPCSSILKRELLATIEQEGDTKVIGYTKEEDDRFYSLQERFPDEKFSAPLIEQGLDKSDCLALIDRAGIQLPLMYRMGYQNANCIGCPKGGQNYWQAIRRDFPSQFVQIQGIQEGIGPSANFLRFRSGPRVGERMSLAELPAGDGNMAEEANFSCSFFCELAENEINKQGE